MARGRAAWIFASLAALGAGCGGSPPPPPPAEPESVTEWSLPGTSCRAPEKPALGSPEADAFTRCGCQQGHALSCALLGNQAQARGDTDAAVQWYVSACSLQHGESCRVVAAIHEQRGQGFVDWLQKACRLRSAPACDAAAVAEAAQAKDLVKLTSMCTTEKRAGACLAALRLTEDGTQMRRLAEAGCQLADPGCCTLFGYLIVSGAVPGKSKAEGVELLRDACVKKRGAACTRLGTAILKGAGAKPSPADAAGHFAQGCELGDAVGCANLGILYKRGSGVARDPEQSRAYLKKACDLGDKPSCQASGGP